MHSTVSPPSHSSPSRCSAHSPVSPRLIPTLPPPPPSTPSHLSTARPTPPHVSHQLRPRVPSGNLRLVLGVATAPPRLPLALSSLCSAMCVVGASGAARGMENEAELQSLQLWGAAVAAAVGIERGVPTFSERAQEPVGHGSAGRCELAGRNHAPSAATDTRCQQQTP